MDKTRETGHTCHLASPGPPTTHHPPFPELWALAAGADGERRRRDSSSLGCLAGRSETCRSKSEPGGLTFEWVSSPDLGSAPRQPRPAALPAPGGVAERRLYPPRAPWSARPRAMVTLGAEVGAEQVPSSSHNEGGRRGARPAGAVSASPAPREAAQPPEPEKRQQVVSRWRGAARLGVGTPSGCPEHLVHSDTIAEPLFSRSR
ncbi:hypothetical protein J1605_008717 [Eschrichtius robustus]|uniref:Uncharacterized protein n=1 Tax=Eschrichtius robustus TaxID=9764 RepID=A0AB34GW13_ESCRO|nr:hypothetical protein J1605_008717 [Eschrichtius robustus]